MAGVDRPDWSGDEIVPSNPVSDWPAQEIARPDWSSESLPAQSANMHSETTGTETDLPAPLLEQWQDDPAGHDYRLGVAQASAMAVLEELDADDRQSVEQGFQSLSEPAQSAILGELAMEPSGKAKSLNDDELNDYCGSDEGALLVGFWRNQAGRKFGVIEQRLKRIETGLPPGDWSAAVAWFDGLPSQGKIAALCVLAG